MDIVQPDATKVRGISEQIQIARTANEFGVRCRTWLEHRGWLSRQTCSLPQRPQPPT